jgi:D-lyxose ketol-isomerase
MKRSEVNRIIREAEAFFAEHRFALPPFASWTPEDWKGRGRDADEIRTRQLGWDLTDFGLGRFLEKGLLLFTVRNGDWNDPASKKYAEKAMIVEDAQVTVWHFHWQKTEDIMNRGGGRLVIELANASEDESELSDVPVEVSCDGVKRTVEPRGRVVLGPGESITLVPRLYHTFWGEGKVLVGEVSSVNDDTSDNRFLEPLGRAVSIEEDEPPYRLLCNEYTPAAS